MMMKIAFLLIILTIVQLNATVYSQSKLFTFNIENEPVKHVLKEIESTSNFRFFYNDELLNTFEVISLNVKNQRVDQVLDKLLEGKSLSYTILEDNLIVITPINKERQELLVTGSVVDANGTPLPGVNILVKGTTTGSITDSDGRYSITVPSENSVLVFSFVGYLREEIPVNGQTELNITMVEDIQALEQVVVVGYGTQRKDDLTGSVTVVDADEMANSNFNSVDKALQGRASGVYVSSTSGRPGAKASIKVRGVGSINLDSEPLIVVDGMPTDDQNILTSINPNDIESMQILKDASAQAIYGARGANGVIIISTKKGEAGKPRFNFNAYWGQTQMAKKYDVMDAEQYVDFYEEAYKDVPISASNNYYYRVYSDSARQSNQNFNNTNWQDELTQKGNIQNYNMGVSGGSENTSFFLSGSYAKEEGIMVNTGMERYTFRANSDFKVNNWLTIGENLTFIYKDLDLESHYTNFNPWRVTGVASPLMPLHDENAPGGYGGPTDSLSGANERTNPVAEQMLNEHTNLENWLLANIYTDITIFKGLTYKLSVNANFKTNEIRQWSPVYTLGNLNLRDNDVNSLQENRSKRRELIISNLLNYQRKFGQHSIELLAGFERTEIDDNYILAEGKNFDFNDLQALDLARDLSRMNGGFTEHNLLSYLGRVNYNFAGKYLLTVNFRRDGSSRFGEIGGRWGNFPSFSAGWKVNEDLLKNVDEISMLKLRLGWGQTGNENLQDYWYINLLDPPQNSRYTFGVNQELYQAFASTSFQANPRIKWEATEMTNIGLDLNLFDNRVLFTSEYYIKNQDDMLVQAPISVVFGKRVNWGTGAPTVGSWVNIGKVQNKGFELSASYRKREGVFKFDVGANLTTINNKILELPVGDQITAYSGAIEGHPIGSLYGYVAERIFQEEDFDDDGRPVSGIRQRNAEPGDIKYKDVLQDSVINEQDRTIIGNPIPKMVYGFNFNANYKGFDVGVLLQGMYDLDVFNDQMRYIGIATNPSSKDENKLVDALDYWTPENPSTTMTKISLEDENVNSRISSWFVEDASFLRVKTIQLGYTLPTELTNRINVNNLRIYINANNLFTFTNYSGYDPEVGSTNAFRMGVDQGYYPSAKTYTLGVQLDL